MGVIWNLLIVYEHQRALVYRNGRYVRTVGPGRHRLWRPLLRETAVVFDMRQQAITLAGQEILTSNHVPIRLALAANYRVADAVAAQHEVENWMQQLYLELQLALREIVAGLTFDALLEQKAALGEQVLAAVAPSAARYGVELLRAAIKDVMMPASIREMMLKTVEAEKSAAASLIKAREEVAAARARANAARMVAEQPAALRLKELEALAEVAKSPASTIVFAGSAGLGGLIASASGRNGKNANTEGA
jgi:regulator of protease activity HflC (stomatin/prohibitin superfamily)